MAVSDESAAGNSNQPKPKALSKRVFRPLTSNQWNLARIQFETGDEHVTLRHIATIFNTSLSAVQKRSGKESWSKSAKIVQDARSELQRATKRALAVAAEKTGSQVAQSLMKDLQPFIEQEKRSHILRALKRSKRGLKRLDRVAKGYEVFDAKRGELVKCDTNPKDEMQIAQAEERYDGIIRRNLGMGEGNALGGAFGSTGIQVLCNQAVVQVSQS